MKRPKLKKPDTITFLRSDWDAFFDKKSPTWDNVKRALEAMENPRYAK